MFDGTPVRSAAEYCYVLARVLNILGYDTKIVRARALIRHATERQAPPVALVGTDSEGNYATTASGRSHVIVLARHFRRFVDVALFLRPEFRRVYPTKPEISWPVVFGSATDEFPETEFSAMTVRDTFAIQYVVEPELAMDLRQLGFRRETVVELERLVAGITWKATSALLSVYSSDPNQFTPNEPVFPILFDPPQRIPMS
ncbi:hypothetical protein ACPXB1_17990 [Micromonospora sp. DT68]|uniref:hypothetical protein n=1 Tax=Micromonospora sp. DT68 TaxID=3416522 RepID=UPI003CFA6717